jgi:2-polyprenyl-3-methyl-5-hydroxy-6-metoxy-1,4-benzoquinol methylase
MRSRESRMDLEQIVRRRREIIDRDGPWTSHNIHLGHGLYTRDPHAGTDVKLRRVTQLVADAAGGKLAGLRVLDLACLEGGYALALSRRGARTVGIEGREVSVTKARFAAEALGVDDAEFLQGDVRDLSVEKHGRFDVVLCLGILYHLEAPDVFRFVESIAEVCSGFAVIDTHVGLRGRDARTYKGQEYRGFTFQEHAPASGAQERLRSLWASLDNSTSFWPTRPSLLNLLARSGFTSILECQVPAEPEKPPDRLTLLAFRGTQEPPGGEPDDGREANLVPERSSARPHPDQRRFALVRRALPAPLRRLGSGMRRLLGG